MGSIGNFLMSLVLAALIFHTVVGDEPKDCAPCSCEHIINKYYEMYCKDVTIDQIEKAVDKIRDDSTYFYSVSIHSSKITTLELNSTRSNGTRKLLFERMRLNDFLVEAPNLINIPDDLFEGQINQLGYVEFDKLPLEEVPYTKIENLRKLLRFTIKNSPKLATVSAWDIDSVLVISNIDLQNNGIETIETNAFQYYQDLIELKLQFNKIRNIDHLILPKGLFYLAINNNQIDKFPGSALSNMEHKSKVIIGNNNIRNLTETDVDYIVKKKYDLEFGHDSHTFDCSGCQFKKIALKNAQGWTSIFYAKCSAPKPTLITHLTTDMYSKCK